MKKYALISAISFLVGLLLAGYVFVYLPDKNPPQTSALEAPSAGAFSSALFASPQAADKPDLDFATIAEKIGPSVVRISAERKEPMQSFGFDDNWPFGDDFFDRFFGRPSPRRNRPESQTVTVGGTGFFISSDGYILTNNHLVEKDKTTRVNVTTLQGNEYEAEIVGTDPGTDLALLKIKAKDLPFAELGDSGKVRVGEWVLAIGNPLGMDHTVTAGIVSYKGRQIDSQSYEDFIQTDAAINRGNSGGPLVNTKGEVIGINSNILTQGTPGNIGIGLSIPSNIAKKVVVQLKEKGRVIRGYLGVYPGDISQGLAKTLNLESRDGIVVNDVEKDGPAEKAGLKQYDVITAINGEPIKDVNDLRFKIADIAPGTKVRLTVVRDGKEQTITANLTELKAQEAADQAAEPETEIGISVTPLTPSIANRYRLQTTEGLLITDVAPSSEAARQGLARGMIILEVNRKKVATVREFENLIAKTEKGDEVILLVRRETEERSQDFIVPVKVR
jgi:serine protease Do